MNDPDSQPIYQPWQPADLAETDTAFILEDDFIPVVPAHDLSRALAWTVARAFRLNPESGVVPVQGYAIPSADGGGAIPPEAAVFDLTAVTLETDSGNRALDLNRQSPHTFGAAPRPPEICHAQAIILSVTVSHPDGEMAEGDFLTDLLVSGQAGDDNALAAFTAGSWHRNAGWWRSQQSELADLICEVFWDRTATNATDEDRQRYRDRICSEIGRLMDHAQAEAAEPLSTSDHQATISEPETAAAPARQLSLLE